MPSVAAQTYPHVEHVVVSDGPDPALAARLAGRGVRFAQLADHDPQVRWGHRARLHGIDLAAGDLICYLDDDNAYRPDHVARLVAALTEARHAGFAYSKMVIHDRTQPDSEVGQDPPVYGQIDTSLICHRRGLLDVADWRDTGSLPEPDWDLVARWLAAGVAWCFVDEVTVDYYRR